MPKIFQSILVALTCASLIGCSNSTNLTLQDMNCESSKIIIKTSLGDMQAELYPELVPDTVKNFCYHIAEKNYDDILNNLKKVLNENNIEFSLVSDDNIIE